MIAEIKKAKKAKKGKMSIRDGLGGCAVDIV